MSVERVVEEIVTKFFLNTCRLRPQLSMPAVQAAMRCAQAARHRHDDTDAECIPLTTGSAAEFYIEPMLPHVGDIDVMCYRSTQLAIPRGHPPPTQLPAEFHNYVMLYEIIDSHLPGYVYLKIRYLLTESVDDVGKYNSVDYHEQRVYLATDRQTGDKSKMHGPAIVNVFSGRELPCDIVFCVRCLVWPMEVADWPTRHRNYGWPDSATVDRVVSDGCDVVRVAHRQCRQHEWRSDRQWRLSFSRAEIVLINSWMPVQQIVYHLLRVFVKTERLTDSADNSEAGTLSNYHIKTLMLWACELKSRNWWTDNLSLVRICVQLLHTMGNWLTGARCQHYFINNCNLIDNSCNAATTAGQLMSVDDTWLSTWFVDSYIRNCSELCPNSILRLFDDVTTTMKLHDAVSAVVAWRLNNSHLELWDIFSFSMRSIASVVNMQPLTAQSCACWITELTKINSSLLPYFTAVAFLHVSYKLSRHGLNDELMDVLATLFGQIGRLRRHSYNTSLFTLDTAAKLMKAAAIKPLSNMSLIATELSKAYLSRVLAYKDNDSMCCLANAYLAVLYYATGQYQTAIDHCTLVTRSHQDHSQCSSHAVQGELLPKIDDDIDNMLGLSVFYQYIQATALNHQCSARHLSVLTTELFAYYLHIKYLLLPVCHFMRTTLKDEFKRYEICISDTVELFVADVLLFVSLSRLLKQKLYYKAVCRHLCQPTVNTNENNAAYLVELLQKSAVEHLTSFRQIESHEFRSVDTIVTTDFEALYAYKRGDYQRCLQVSTQNVHTLSYSAGMSEFPILPEFIQLLDDDIVSLNALTLMVNRKHYGFISQLTLSLYLMTQCQLKLRHSVTSLARTFHYTKVAQRRHSIDRTLDCLTLKLTERKVVSYIRTLVSFSV